MATEAKTASQSGFVSKIGRSAWNAWSAVLDFLADFTGTAILFSLLCFVACSAFAWVMLSDTPAPIVVEAQLPQNAEVVARNNVSPTGFEIECSPQDLLERSAKSTDPVLVTYGSDDRTESCLIEYWLPRGELMYYHATTTVGQPSSWNYRGIKIRDVSADNGTFMIHPERSTGVKVVLILVSMVFLDPCHRGEVGPGVVGRLVILSGASAPAALHRASRGAAFLFGRVQPPLLDLLTCSLMRDSFTVLILYSLSMKYGQLKVLWGQKKSNFLKSFILIGGIAIVTIVGVGWFSVERVKQVEASELLEPVWTREDPLTQKVVDSGLLVVDDTLYINSASTGSDTNGVILTALDTATGAVQWSSFCCKFGFGTPQAMPIYLLNNGGNRELLQTYVMRPQLSGKTFIKGQRYTLDGQKLGNPVTLIERDDPNYDKIFSEYFLLPVNENEAIIVFQEPVAEPLSRDITYQRIAMNGAPLGDPITVASAVPFGSDLAATFDPQIGRLTILWNEYDGFYLKQYDAAGNITTDRTLFYARPLDYVWIPVNTLDVVSFDGSHALVALKEQVIRNLGMVMTFRINPDGSFTGPIATLTTDANYRAMIVKNPTDNTRARIGWNGFYFASADVDANGALITGTRNDYNAYGYYQTFTIDAQHRMFWVYAKPYTSSGTADMYALTF